MARGAGGGDGLGRTGPLGLRYHLVSLMAVFLALGVGIFIGAGLLDDQTVLQHQQALIEGLEEDFNALRQETAALRAENRRLSAQLARYGQAERMLSSLAVEGRLAGRAVAMVVLGSADSPTAASARQVLQAAGASLTPNVTVDPGLARLKDPWAQLVGHTLGEPSADTPRLARGVAQALAAAVLTGRPASPLVDRLATAGGLSLQGPVNGPGGALVVVHGDAGPAEPILRPLLQALVQAGLTVVGFAPAPSPRDRVYADANVVLVTADTAGAPVSLVFTLAGQQDRLAQLEGST